MPTPTQVPFESPAFWLILGFSLLCAVSIFLWVARLPAKVPESHAREWGFPDMRWMDMLTLLALCFLAVFLAVTLIQLLTKALSIGGTEFAILANFAMQGSLILAICILREKLPATYGTPLSRQNALPLGASLRYAAITFLKFLPIIWIVNLGVQSGLEMLGIKLEQQKPVKLILDTLQNSPLKFAALTFGAVVMAPLAEELLFRGCIYRFLLGKTTMEGAALFSAALFAAIHYHLAAFLPLFFLGYLFARTYQVTGNIAAPICFHALFNATTITIMLMSPWFPETQK